MASKDKTYLDIEALAEGENPAFIELRADLVAWEEGKRYLDELEEQLKTLVKRIKPKFEELGVDGMLLGKVKKRGMTPEGSKGIEIISQDGRTSCDWTVAERILTPAQLKKIKKKGDDYSYLQRMKSEKSIAAARASLE